MMIVVVIMGILAGLAMVAFRRYVGRARTAEAVAMLAEMASKEQVYFLEFGSYLPLRSDNSVALPSPDETASAFYPISPNSATFESARTATSISNSALWPTAWRSVGLRPKQQQLFCTYLTNAGGAGQAVPAAATVGTTVMGTLGSTAPAWFYSIAACNLTGASGFPANVTYFVVSSTSPSLKRYNDGK
jgi:Tfp pilus assembly protein PilE